MVLSLDIDATSADPLGVAAMLLFEFLGLCNQIFSLAVWIPVDSVQERKAVPNGYTDFGPNSAAAFTLPRTIGCAWL